MLLVHDAVHPESMGARNIGKVLDGAECGIPVAGAANAGNASCSEVPELDKDSLVDTWLEA